MNLHIPDVRILEVHTAPWSNPTISANLHRFSRSGTLWDFRSCCTP